MRPFQELIDRLVDQFADPFAFLRELIQNAMDAGSLRIDVELRYSAADELFMLECQDTGEGMDEQAIDRRLTRVFASSKEADLTKIGKFGIGFLSVFALQPQAVVVDTGKNGERWRVRFRQDRSFEKLVLDEAIEGTRIRWLKPMTAGEAGPFETDCRSALARWCKHAESEIYLNGELLNEPFAHDSPFAVTWSEPGTNLSLAPSLDETPLVGFYNRGLTLAESRLPFLPGVTWRASSRYLEHTLTRDSVEQDAHFQKILEAARRAVREKLLPALLAGGEAALPYLPRFLNQLSPQQRSLPLFPGIGEQRYSLDDLREENQELLISDGASEVAVRLVEKGRRVVLGSAAMRAFLAGANLLATDVQARFVLPAPVAPTAHQETLLRKLAPLLAERSLPYRSVHLARLDRGLLSLPCEQAGQMVDLRSPGSPTALLLNAHHPRLRPLLDLDPAWGPAPLLPLLREILGPEALSASDQTAVLLRVLE